jgi:RHS repeat-associated protein
MARLATPGPSVTPVVGHALTLGYDQANRLTSYATSSTTAYGYNGDGLRMSKIAGSTTQFVWDVAASLPLLLKDGATAYIYGPAGVPLEQINGSTTYYFHHDQLGSTRLLTDSSGTAQATYTFDPYGNLVASTGSITNPLLFSGQYRDSESGLYYMRARYYDPSTGQFASMDPSVASTREPYAYVYNNPVNLTDATGLDAWGDFQNFVVGVSLRLPGWARSAEVAGFGGATTWVGQTRADLVSCDPSRIANAVFQSLLVAGMLVPGEGEGEAGALTVGKVLEGKLGSITRASLPKGAPGWDAIRGMTMSEVEQRAKSNEPGFKTMWKLLRDKRFDK